VVEEALALLSADERSGFTSRWPCLRKAPAIAHAGVHPGEEERHSCLSS